MEAVEVHIAILTDMENIIYPENQLGGAGTWAQHSNIRFQHISLENGSLIFINMFCFIVNPVLLNRLLL